MKNLFEIDSNEIKRILSLHEESTKKQYLNVISEETSETSITLPAGTYHRITAGTPESVISLPNGTIFSKTKDPNILITNQDKFYHHLGNKLAQGQITYNCTTGKFKVPSNSSKDYNELDKNGVETKYLKPFCPKVLQQNTQTKKPLTPKEQLERAKKCGYSTWEEYKKGKNGQPWFCSNTNKIDSSQVTTFTPQQMTDTIKQVQQSVGIQNPTGQITDADVDALIAKLSEN